MTGTSADITLDQVLELAERLPPADQVRLIERLAPKIARALTTAQPTPRESLRGLWQGLDITEEDLAEVRREMWGTFPREDI